MRLTDILSESRIVIDPAGQRAPDKPKALETLASILANDLGIDAQTVLEPLLERERLQSTGIGDGVAIPHCSLVSATTQTAALLISRQGVPFDSIDGESAKIIFAVVGPKKAASDHLKILAKISRLLRSPETRRRLQESETSNQAFGLIQEHDERSLVP